MSARESVALFPVVTLMSHASLTLLLGLMLAPSACALQSAEHAPAEPAPAELGQVHWLRDLDAGLAASRQSGLPVFVLFQEVPGCATCVAFGQDALSQPLLVEAIETLFVPVCIDNSAGGKDAEMLRRYDEPAFNFPVCRFFGPDGTELLPRRDRIWTSGGIATRMVGALAAAGRPAPEWLLLAEAGLALERQQTATFAMSCFWEGEAHLGALEGVVSTRPGFVAGQEVVEVAYDPTRVAYGTLVKEAGSMQCASTVWAHAGEQLAAAKELVGERARELTGPVRDAGADDRTRSLAGRPAAYLPLLPVQAARVNAALAGGAAIGPWLSPRQLALLAAVEAALRADSHALDGLVRPLVVDKLPAYQAALAGRLAAAVPEAPRNS